MTTKSNDPTPLADLSVSELKDRAIQVIVSLANVQLPGEAVTVSQHVGNVLDEFVRRLEHQTTVPAAAPEPTRRRIVAVVPNLVVFDNGDSAFYDGSEGKWRRGSNIYADLESAEASQEV